MKSKKKLTARISKEEERRIEEKLKEIEGLIPFKGGGAELVRKIREGKPLKLKY